MSQALQLLERRSQRREGRAAQRILVEAQEPRGGGGRGERALSSSSPSLGHCLEQDVSKTLSEEYICLHPSFLCREERAFLGV